MMPTQRNEKILDLMTVVEINKFTHVISAKLAVYIENYVKTLNKLKIEGCTVDNLYYLKIKDFSESTLNNLYIDNLIAYEKADASIELASHMLNISLKQKEIDSLLIGFYDLENDLKQLDVFKK